MNEGRVDTTRPNPYLLHEFSDDPLPPLQCQGEEPAGIRQVSQMEEQLEDQGQGLGVPLHRAWLHLNGLSEAVEQDMVHCHVRVQHHAHNQAAGLEGN